MTRSNYKAQLEITSNGALVRTAQRAVSP